LRLPPEPRVAALLTSHNRRDETLASLDALTAAQRFAQIGVTIYLVDAGSTDGTAEAVAAQFPESRISTVGDDVFWNAGMRLAFAGAVADGGFSHFLWLNDDTRLDHDAITRLLDASETAPTGIITGATRDPDDGQLTYGGVVRPFRRRPLRFVLVQPPEHGTREVETMNGNVVLIPAAVVARIGLLDPGFSHGMGDYDYGLRATRDGIPVLLASGTVGTCRRNPRTGPLRSARAELRRLRQTKQLPPGEWARFARRWAGPAWPLYALSPYARRVLAALRSV
jgi:GT2 family glycosyltransferase